LYFNAERLSNAHDYIPIIFGQPFEMDLQFQTKSFAQNALPFQQYQTALWNASTASKRRAVMDRGLYDPSRVSETVINSPNPSAKMPVRPAAYGSLSEKPTMQFLTKMNSVRVPCRSRTCK